MCTALNRVGQLLLLLFCLGLSTWTTGTPGWDLLLVWVKQQIFSNRP